LASSPFFIGCSGVNIQNEDEQYLHDVACPFYIKIVRQCELSYEFEKGNFERSKTSEAFTIIEKMMLSRYSFFENPKVNIPHIVVAFGASEGLERLRTNDFESFVFDGCISDFKVGVKDFDRIKNSESVEKNYYLRSWDNHAVKKYRACIDLRLDDTVLNNSQIEIFLSDPALVKYKNFDLVRREINIAKLDNSISLNEVSKIYDAVLQKQAQEINLKFKNF
jgi:hypothetical protein